MQFQTNHASQSQDIRRKLNFGPKLGLNGPNFDPKFIFSHLYHNMQNKENLVIQARENDRILEIWANIWANFFFENWASSLFSTYLRLA